MKRIFLIVVLLTFALMPMFSQDLPTDIPEVDLQSNPIITEYEEETSDVSQSEFDLNIIKRDQSYKITLSPALLYTGPSTSPDSHIHTEGKFGFGAGVMCNLRLGRRNKSARGGTGKFAFDLGLFYTYSKYNTKVYYLGSNHDDHMYLHCLQIPLTFQFYPWAGFYMEGGASYNRVIKATPHYLSINEFEKLDLSAMKSSDIRIIVGVGYEVGAFILGGRLTYPTSSLVGNFKMKISEIQGFIRYNFKIVNR